MTRTAYLHLLAACLVSSSIPSSLAHSIAAYGAVHHSILFNRANGCATSNYKSCGIPGLPNNFCCPSDQKCIAFNDNKSAICCPAGQDCKTIAPLTCDISKQDPSKSPSSQLHSTDLSGTLEKCGTSCCPRGYSCKNSNCVMASTPSSSSSKPPSSASHSPSGSSTGASSSGQGAKTSEAAKSSSTGTNSHPTPSPQNSTATASDGNKITGVGLVVGILVGMIVGIIATVLCICAIGRRRVTRATKANESSVFSSPAATVSDPIYQGDAPRNDFLRRQPQDVDTTNPNVPKRTSRVRSLVTRSPTVPRHDHNLQSPMRTPERPGREPSMEEIHIYNSPPSMANRPEPRQTQFGDLIDQLDRNITYSSRGGEDKPYLGSPGRVVRPTSSIYDSRAPASNV